MDLRRAAVSLREAAAQKNIEVRIRTGLPGNLQIFKNGAKLFDHKQTGTLPETSALLRLIEAAP
jgi:predicted Rdx family selenoprotein